MKYSVSWRVWKMDPVTVWWEGVVEGVVEGVASHAAVAAYEAGTMSEVYCPANVRDLTLAGICMLHPEFDRRFVCLQSLTLSDMSFDQPLPLCCLTRLEKVVIRDGTSGRLALPGVFRHNLRVLALRNVNVDIADDFDVLELHELSFVNCRLDVLPPPILRMTTLVELRLDNCHIASFAGIGQLTNLQVLRIYESSCLPPPNYTFGARVGSVGWGMRLLNWVDEPWMLPDDLGLLLDEALHHFDTDGPRWDVYCEAMGVRYRTPEAMILPRAQQFYTQRLLVFLEYCYAVRKAARTLRLLPLPVELVAHIVSYL